MKFTRSVKCSIKFATKHKKQKLENILQEYGRVCNFFIQHFWDKEVSKAQLFKEIVNLPETWLSARLRKVAAQV
jgi:hypothetical protein